MSVFDDLLQTVHNTTIVDLFNFSAGELKDVASVSRLRALARGILTPSEAYEILEKLLPILNDTSFKQSAPAAYALLQLTADHLRFEALPFQNSGEVKQLFKSKLLFALQDDIKLVQVVSTYLLALADDYTGRQSRGEILQALKENEELFPTPVASAERSNQARLAVVTIKGWLADYDGSGGLGKQRGAFERAQYLSNSSTARKLSEYERKMLTEILELYDFLNFSVVVWPSDLLPTRPAAETNESTSDQVEAPTSAPISKATPSMVDDRAIHTPQVLIGVGPAFLFDVSDELEADKFRAAGALPSASNLEAQLRLLAEQVITAHKFNFKDESSKRRFVSLFVSRLKGVRDVVDVREVLLKSVNLGGLGLPTDKAEQVIAIIERAKQEFEAQPKIQKQTRPASPVTSSQEPAVIPPSLQALTPGVVLPKSDKVGSVPPLPEGSAKPESAVGANWRQEMLEEIARLAPEVPPATSTAKRLEPVTSAPPSRPQLEDVKAPHRTLGPLEELKVLSLTDFRRLDPSPVEALARVRAKIDLIGEASVARRLEAVRAWQASPLYQLYLTLGRESIEQGKVVAQVVADRQAAGQPTMSEAEFDAIVDFNTKIRF